MTYSLVLSSIAIWILLGIFADKICETQAKKDGKYYEGKVQVACYLAGPVIIPLAFLRTFWKWGLHIIFRS